MNKLKEDFKHEFEQLDLSLEKYDNINKKIKEKHKEEIKRKKIIFSIIAVISTLCITSGIVYADEIKTYVENVISSIKKTQNKGTTGKEHDVIEMYLEPLENLNTNPKFNKKNYNCKIDEIKGLRNHDNCEIYSKKELEKLLNIKVLTNASIKNNDFIIDGYKKDESGNITYIEIDQPNIFKIKLGENDKQKPHNLVVTMRLKIKSKYHKGNTGKLYALDGKHTVEEYYINNLKVKSLIVKEANDSMEESLQKEDYRRVYFIHNNIGYILDIYSNGNEDNFEKEIKKLLENLTI